MKYQFEATCTVRPVAGGDSLVLTHGAGANCDSPLLVALADAFCASGLPSSALISPSASCGRRGHPHVAVRNVINRDSERQLRPCGD